MRERVAARMPRVAVAVEVDHRDGPIDWIQRSQGWQDDAVIPICCLSTACDC